MDGKPYFPYWGKFTVAVDPIEKKPLHHFLPNSKCFSYGTVGCNFSCQFCQNSSLSMWEKDIEDIAMLETGVRLRKFTPEQMVQLALDNDCLSIASTYNEPTITSEFSHEVFRLAKEKGLKTVYVTNGYESDTCINYMAPVLDAVNIDLKAFSNTFYKKILGAQLSPVLQTIRKCFEIGIHTEVTTLVIPGENDSDKELTDIATFLASVSPDIPWHISAYHDDYLFEGRGRTPLQTLERAYKIGKAAGLNFIYIGNVQCAEKRFTVCPECGRTLIEREWFGARMLCNKGRCQCGYQLPGVF